MGRLQLQNEFILKFAQSVITEFFDEIFWIFWPVTSFYVKKHRRIYQLHKDISYST